MNSEEFRKALTLLINEALRDLTINDVLADVYLAHRQLEVMFDVDALNRLATPSEEE